MKKYVIVLLSLLLIVFAGCESENKDVAENKAVAKKDLAGTYADFSLRDPLGVYTDFLVGDRKR